MIEIAFQGKEAWRVDEVKSVATAGVLAAMESPGGISTCNDDAESFVDFFFWCRKLPCGELDGARRRRRRNVVCTRIRCN